MPRKENEFGKDELHAHQFEYRTMICYLCGITAEEIETTIERHIKMSEVEDPDETTKDENQDEETQSQPQQAENTTPAEGESSEDQSSESESGSEDQATNEQ